MPTLRPYRIALTGAMLVLLTAGAGAQRATDSATVVATVARFHSALAAGDSTAALGLLADEVMIMEGGEIQTRAEYRASHLAADIRASASSPSTNAVKQVTVQGDAAWVISTMTSQRQTGATTRTSITAELMVLKRTTAGWRITAVHWSARSGRGG